MLPRFLCVAGFNLSCGLQTHSVVSPTTFPTLDKLPISHGFAIFVCNVYMRAHVLAMF